MKCGVAKGTVKVNGQQRKCLACDKVYETAVAMLAADCVPPGQTEPLTIPDAESVNRRPAGW